jgi:hypothetical protein
VGVVPAPDLAAGAMDLRQESCRVPCQQLRQGQHPVCSALACPPLALLVANFVPGVAPVRTLAHFRLVAKGVARGLPWDTVARLYGVRDTGAFFALRSPWPALAVRKNVWASPTPHTTCAAHGTYWAVVVQGLAHPDAALYVSARQHVVHVVLDRKGRSAPQHQRLKGAHVRLCLEKDPKEPSSAGGVVHLTLQGLWVPAPRVLAVAVPHAPKIASRHSVAAGTSCPRVGSASGPTLPPSAAAPLPLQPQPQPQPHRRQGVRPRLQVHETLPSAGAVAP